MSALQCTHPLNALAEIMLNNKGLNVDSVEMVAPSSSQSNHCFQVLGKDQHIIGGQNQLVHVSKFKGGLFQISLSKKEYCSELDLAIANRISTLNAMGFHSH